jgi:hypothetical protein
LPVPDYWLDADVLIRAKNEYYAFDLASHFWEFLEQKGLEAVVASCRAVYDELVQKDDELKAWAVRQHRNGFFWEPDEQVQAKYRTIADYVTATYRPAFGKPFLAKGDAWLIAQAAVHGGKVVSLETPAPLGQKPKVPDVAHHFHVQTPNLYEVLRTLGFKFPA